MWPKWKAALAAVGPWNWGSHRHHLSRKKSEISEKLTHGVKNNTSCFDLPCCVRELKLNETHKKAILPVFNKFCALMNTSFLLRKKVPVFHPLWNPFLLLGKNSKYHRWVQEEVLTTVLSVFRLKQHLGFWGKLYLFFLSLKSSIASPWMRCHVAT